MISTTGYPPNEKLGGCFLLGRAPSGAGFRDIPYPDTQRRSIIENYFLWWIRYTVIALWR